MMTRSASILVRRCVAGLGWAMLALLLAAALPQQPLPPDLLGVWKSRAGDDLLRVEPAELVVYEAGHLTAKRVLGFGEGRLFLRSGLVEVWSVARSNGSLHVIHGTKTAVYEHLNSLPPELSIRARTLGDAGPVALERKSEVQAELRARVKEDQAVRKPPFDQAKMAAVDAANTAYLLRLVGQLGWIDVQRFGLQASGDAFLLVQHSGDLPLQLAVLPLIERDARRQQGFGQAYALLYDRTQVDLGRKQRYGSQLDTDAAGNSVVLPLDDPAHVDALRAEIGLSPLKEYLSMVSKAVLQGKPIAIAGDEDFEAAEPAPPGAGQARPAPARAGQDVSISYRNSDGLSWPPCLRCRF